ncbi:hypothetical protein N7448_008240 [Penicillium atrosanguineum]|uniref:protein-histidine N-methyltransferase n=1 Tax=Penicillium atrosanguineum TaxID=1132637 RepID=A0A9W9GR84_9EURO|nr:Pre protein translocase subunit Sec66-domain-containing protein [Penicillium atrosanguineum]KAJ5127461.1 hypothetical protein N7448_008240 [Penicillium atrosanguineum]KAJ5147665.1 hypothetical protein N7526_001017 [Penicillium atrosanguineum]KAJ5313862.1 Pre protein translocase subunit Sec66-domain-containing protein [Penicillium atrosanguineum]KAJ5331033.1 hypothetical protein N7476_000816 [Penicillium atrosanguineum]
MAFSFGFAGDDIDIDDSENNSDIPDVVVPQGTANSLPELVKASQHDMNELLSILPSQIFYNRLPISETPIVIARREIIDIRTQLMAEDSAEHDNAELIAGLEEGDLKPNFYEGGFKTWECALDLAKLVASESAVVESLGNSQTNVHIIELGAGTAVPSLALFAHILGQTESAGDAPQRKAHFTFADYNDAVLRLVTLPNLLLTWWNCRSVATSEALDEMTSEEELDITPELVDDFKNDLTRRGISIDFISGAWSPEFVEFVFSTRCGGDYKTLVMASETIYSPTSLTAFSETLLALLRRSKTDSANSRALIAAKKVYFGVGGGVDEFLAVLRNVGADELEVQHKVDVQSEGVGRVVLEVSLAAE